MVDLDCEVIMILVVDGGEGIVEVVLVVGCYVVIVKCYGVIGDFVEVDYVMCDCYVVIEMVICCGLERVDWVFGWLMFWCGFVVFSCGFGEVIVVVLCKGVIDIIVGVGGLVFIDGGVGMLEVLGVCLFDKNFVLIFFGVVGLMEFICFDLFGFN